MRIARRRKNLRTGGIFPRPGRGYKIREKIRCGDGGDVAGAPLRKKRRRGALQNRGLAKRQQGRREAGEGFAR